MSGAHCPLTSASLTWNVVTLRFVSEMQENEPFAPDPQVPTSIEQYAAAWPTPIGTGH